MVVYLITNTVNGSQYVGCTRCAVEKRWREHKCAANCGVDRPLYRAIRKYGLPAFTIKVIGTADTVDALKASECHYIKELGTYIRLGHGYNLTLGGGGLEPVDRPRGENNATSVLTAPIVKYIRDPDLANTSNKAMQQMVRANFGVLHNLDTLKAARQGKTWKHINAAPVIVKQGTRKPRLSEQQRERIRGHLAVIHGAAVAKSAALRKGKRGLNAKLTEDEVRRIFYAKGSGPEIGRDFGVHKKVIYGIKNRTMHTYLTRSL